LSWSSCAAARETIKAAARPRVQNPDIHSLSRRGRRLIFLPLQTLLIWSFTIFHHLKIGGDINTIDPQLASPTGHLFVSLQSLYR
jgi:hypothetical protein